MANNKNITYDQLQATLNRIKTELDKKANSSHGTHLTLGTGSGNAYRGDYGNTAYQHSQAAHAPSNAQKNSDITKAEIENKLTGTITTHTHNYITASDLNAKGYATQSYVDNNEIITTFYGTSTSAAADSVKIITIDDPKFTLRAGTIIAFKPSVSNSASNVKLNVNGTGAYPIWYSTSEYTSSSATPTGTKDSHNFYMFSGTHWVWISRSNYITYSPASLGFGYGVCSTAESTVAKEATISSYALVTGGIVVIKFTNAVPANATLNIRTRGAKKIFYNGSAITDGLIKAGDVVTLQYDGTQYQVINIERYDAIRYCPYIDGEEDVSIFIDTEITLSSKTSEIIQFGYLPFSEQKCTHKFQVGKQYKIKINDNEYVTCTCKEYIPDNDYIPPHYYLGNYSLVAQYWGSGESTPAPNLGDTGEIFCILIKPPEGVVNIAIPSIKYPATFSLEIAAVLPKYIQLDRNFIQDVPGKIIQRGSSITYPILGDGPGIHFGEETVVVGNGAEIFNDYETNIASGNYSHAEGFSTRALGDNAHAEGSNTVASGYWSHAEGGKTEASGSNSHAEGAYAIASGDSSHAEGEYTRAAGWASHVEGYMTIAKGDVQHVQGMYNIEDTEEKYLHIIGNGSWSDRSNAHTLDWDGNAWFAGGIFVGSKCKKVEVEGEPRDYVVLNDQVTGYRYALQMRNGMLATTPVASSLVMISAPNKTIYMENDGIDLTGLELKLVTDDGSTISVNNDDVIVEPAYATTNNITFKYNDFGTELSVPFTIYIDTFNAATALIDFNYTSNSDGTYTITDWKGTYNGQPSTKIIIPNNKNINL